MLVFFFVFRESEVRLLVERGWEGGVGSLRGDVVCGVWNGDRVVMGGCGVGCSRLMSIVESVCR